MPGGEVPAEAEIIAITPEVAWACQERNLPYSSLDSTAPPDLFARREEIWKALTPWLQWVDSFLQASIPELTGRHFHPARAYVYHFYRLFAEFHSASRILTGFFESVAVTEVYCRVWNRQRALLSLDDRRSIYCSVLPLLAEQHGYKFKGLSAPSGALAPLAPLPETSQFRRFLLWGRSKIPGRILEETRLIYRVGPIAWARSLVTEGGTGKSVLFLGSGYDLDPLAVNLREAGVRVRWMSARMAETVPSDFDDPVTAALMRLWPEVLRHPQFVSPLSGCDVTADPRFAFALATFWHQVLPRLWAAHRNTVARLSAGRWEAVVAGNGGSGGAEGTILQCASGLFGARGVVYQHGGSSNICDWGSYDCLLNATDFLLHGECTEAAFSEASRLDPAFRANLHVVGSARLDAFSSVSGSSPAHAKLRDSIRGTDSRPIILYVPAHYGGYGRAVSDLAGYPDISYFQLQERILRVFAEFPEVRVLYKDFPVADSPPNPIPHFLSTSVPNATVTYVRLTNLMEVVDGIVVDHAITALAEALVTDRPILAYDQRAITDLNSAEGRAWRASGDLLCRRASVAFSPDEFEASTRQFLQTKPWLAPVPQNDDFLRAFCTFRGDGNSLSRAVAKLLELTDSPRAGNSRRS